MEVVLKGTVKAIMATEDVTDNFRKKEMVVVVDEETNYPQEIICQAVNARIDQMNGIDMGMKVTARCNLKGRSKDGRYFLNLEVWKIERN